MKRSWVLSLVLTSPIVLLLSLSLPWQRAPCSTTPVSYFQGNQAPSAGLQNLFAGSCSNTRVNGWSSIGEAAAIAALLLAFLAMIALARPDLRDRLPLGQAGLLVAYLAVAVAVEMRSSARRTAESLKAITGTAVHFHFAYGTYIGGTAGIAALVGTGFLRREQLSSLPSRRALAAVLAACTLLVALLLPWARSGFTAATRQSLLGIEDPAGVITAVLAVRLGVVCWSDQAATFLERVGLAAGALIFTGADFIASFPTVRVYGAWVGLVVGVALLLAVLSRGHSLPLPRLRAVQVLSAVASIVLVTSLFLPWQTACYGQTASLEALRLSGRCVSTNGFDLIGAVSAAAACALALVVLIPRRRRISTLELAACVALLVATLGFRLATGTVEGTRLGFGKGSILGFTATGFLLLLAFTTVGKRPFDLRKLASRAPAISLCIAYVVAVVVPWWGVLPSGVWTVFTPRLWAVSWLTVAGALLGVRLVADWLSASTDRQYELVFLPLMLAALAILDAVQFSHPELTWDSALLLGLSVGLGALGLIDLRGGTRNLPFPEILRVDRI
jgi:hypothetical protein